jgi:hypothetical protein
MNNKTENKERRVRKSITAIFFAVILITTIAPVSASPNQIWPSDSGGMWENVFGEDEIVYVTGDLDPTAEDFIFPAARIYVTENRVWSGGEGLTDVTAGGYNVITGTLLGGGFIGEIVWLPPLTRGRYDLVIDENQNGVYDGIDYVLGAGTDYAFQVGAPVGVTIDVAAIKNDAEDRYKDWHGLATHWHWVSDSATAISAAWSLSTGDALSLVVTGVSWIAGKIGIDIPTDYNSAILTVGGKVIEGFAGVQAAHYDSLHKDPPDPDYTDFATIDMAAINNELTAELVPYGIVAAYPFAPLGNTSYEVAQIELSNNMTMQSALISALQSSIEKYQGAKDAGSDEYTYYQAQAVKKFSDMLLINLNDTKLALINYKTELTSEGLGDYTYRVSDIAALQSHLGNVGITADQRTELKDLGMSDAEIDEWINRTINDEIPAADFTMNNVIEDVTAGIDNSIPVCQNLSKQAQAVMDDIGPYTEKHHPVAVPGGPYTGDEGSPITFDGSGSSDPDGDVLTYEWDFDLDGDFDDASGAIVEWTWNSEFSGMTGLKVNDTTGLSDITYTSVWVSSVNEPPIIDSFSPAELRPTASYLSPLTFSITAHDPDGDSLSYNWTLDGVEVSTNNSWIYTPNATESGLKVVRVTISDGSPLSQDAIERRIVSVVSVYNISLVKGWNLISVPLNLTTWELGEEAVVGDPLNVTLENSLTSIYRYNTTPGSFEKCTHYAGWGWAPATGSESFTELEPGRGYWAMAENDCDLTFTGTAPSDLDVPLDADWNCIGWYSTSEALLGEEAIVGDPLNVTPENSLTSIYRYNTTSESFEKCTHYAGWGWAPATGSESFTELEPGRGYWVMSENDCVWRHEV